MGMIAARRMVQAIPLAFAAAMLASPAQAGVDISTKPTQNMSCSAGVCTPTAKQAYLNVNDVTSMLAAGDLKVTSGSGALDVHVKAPFSWTSASRLTLDAQRSITIEKALVVAGTGGLTLTTNDGGTGGDYWFPTGGSVTFWDLNASLVINGASFRLVNSISMLASEIAQHPLRHYALANAYDASQDGTYSTAPIATTFGGVLEGLGNTISKLSISDTAASDNAALLADLGATGVVRDTVLTMAKVSAVDSDNAGTLVGYNEGLVIHDVASGLVSGATEIGGLAGFNHSGSITQSMAATRVDGNHFVSAGGLVGYNDGWITHSHATGDVSGGKASCVGGLVGNNTRQVSDSYATGAVAAGDAGTAGGLVCSGGQIMNSFATGTVRVGTTLSSYQNRWNAFAGGLIGTTGDVVSSSFATGEVIGGEKSKLGGLVGAVYGRFGEKAKIENSYATGHVVGGDASKAGGLIGYRSKGTSSLTSVYALGPVQAGVNALVGGVIGCDASDSSGKETSFSYWDLDTSGITDPSQGAGNRQYDTGMVGLNDTELKSTLPAGFDPSVWGQSATINNGYPYLLANPPPK